MVQAVSHTHHIPKSKVELTSYAKWLQNLKNKVSPHEYVRAEVMLSNIGMMKYNNENTCKTLKPFGDLQYLDEEYWNKAFDKLAIYRHVHASSL